jgi:hypothetical protein
LRYLTITDVKTNRAELGWWRPRLTGVPDSDDADFSEYKYFKRDVLLPAIKEINLLTDIEVSLNEYKTGRRVTHIQFSSKKKAQEALPINNEQKIVSDAVIKRMIAIGINESLASKIYSDNEENDIILTLDYVEERIDRGGVASPAALFRDALKKGYGKAETEKKTKGTHPAGKIFDGASSEIKETKQAEPQVDAAKTYFDALDEKQRAEFLDVFSKNLSGPILDSYKKYGLSSKIVQAELLGYIRRLAK